MICYIFRHGQVWVGLGFEGIVNPISGMQRGLALLRGPLVGLAPRGLQAYTTGGLVDSRSGGLLVSTSVGLLDSRSVGLLERARACGLGCQAARWASDGMRRNARRSKVHLH